MTDRSQIYSEFANMFSSYWRLVYDDILPNQVNWQLDPGVSSALDDLELIHLNKRELLLYPVVAWVKACITLAQCGTHHCSLCTLRKWLDKRYLRLNTCEQISHWNVLTSPTPCIDDRCRIKVPLCLKTWEQMLHWNILTSATPCMIVVRCGFMSSFPAKLLS